MITRTTLKCGGFSNKHFTKYIAENGNAVCTINNEIVGRNAGNDIYRALKADGAVVTERDTYDMDDNEIIEYLESGIDKYVQYIENYNQYAQAQEHNDKLHKLIAEFRRIAK